MKKRSQQIHSTSDLSEGREKLGLSAEYIVGLTDGEGCFYVQIREPNLTHKSYRIEMHFFIKLREDDLLLLEKVRDFFGCGGVYFQKEYRINQRNCYRYSVTARKDLFNIIIPFFDKHPLQSKKINNFLLFRQIAFLLKGKNYRKNKSILKIRQLKGVMNRGSLDAGNPLV